MLFGCFSTSVRSPPLNAQCREVLSLNFPTFAGTGHYLVVW